MGFAPVGTPNLEGLRDLESHVAMLRILEIACCDLEVQRSPEVWTGAKRKKKGCVRVMCWHEVRFVTVRGTFSMSTIEESKVECFAWGLTC